MRECQIPELRGLTTTERQRRDEENDAMRWKSVAIRETEGEKKKRFQRQIDAMDYLSHPELAPSDEERDAIRSKIRLGKGGWYSTKKGDWT